MLIYGLAGDKTPNFVDTKTFKKLTADNEHCKTMLNKKIA